MNDQNECPRCRGSGRCPVCFGTGKTYPPSPDATQNQACFYCDRQSGNGLCSECRGTGKV